MTIKNQLRKDVARLSVFCIVILGGIQLSVQAHAQAQADSGGYSKDNPGPAAKRRADERDARWWGVIKSVVDAQTISDAETVRFVPEKQIASKFLNSTARVVKVDGIKVMTVEAAMYEYLNQFDQAMAEAKKWKGKRLGVFESQDQKINAKAFDAAVVLARQSLNEYQALLSQTNELMKESFGKLLKGVRPEDLKLTSQAGVATPLADVFVKSELGVSMIQENEFHKGGMYQQYRELLNAQEGMKSPLSSGISNKQAATQLRIYLQQVRDAESRGVSALTKDVRVDLANIEAGTEHRSNGAGPRAGYKLPGASDAIQAARLRQPTSLKILAAMKKAQRGGPVTLLVGGAGFLASGMATAGEATSLPIAGDEPVERSVDAGWARVNKPAHRTSN